MKKENIFDRLRKKPEAKRNKILYVTMLSVMTVVIFIWILALEHRYRVEVTRESWQDDFETFNILKEDISNSFDEVKKNLEKAKN
jgi:hypothetical protein